MVTPLIVSLNLCGFIKLSKKLTEDDLKKDLAISCDFGTTIEVNIICIRVNKIDTLKIKLIICILCIPKFQNIINSLFSSYFIVT